MPKPFVDLHARLCHPHRRGAMPTAITGLAPLEIPVAEIADMMRL